MKLQAYLNSQYQAMAAKLGELYLQKYNIDQQIQELNHRIQTLNLISPDLNKIESQIHEEHKNSGAKNDNETASKA